MYLISLKSNELSNYVTGDFNLNVLDYNKNKKFMKFLNLITEYGLFPVINKPTRVTKNTTTAIYHFITHPLLYRTINTGIIKHHISHHFAIFFKAETESQKTYEHEINYKNYGKLFYSIKQTGKLLYYSKVILHYKDNIKKLGKLLRK